MKFFTILNTLHWQEVTATIDLTKVKTSHRHNIHMTLEDNGNLAVLFQTGHTTARKHDNKIVAENDAEAIAIISQFLAEYPKHELQKTYSYILARFGDFSRASAEEASTMPDNENPFIQTKIDEGEIVLEKALENPSKAIKRAREREEKFQARHKSKNPPAYTHTVKVTIKD